LKEDRQNGESFVDDSVEPGIWRFARATRATLIVDAGDYFDLMQQAMLAGRKRIMLIGWDFDTRIPLARGRRWWQLRRKGNFPRRLGAFVLWLTRHRPQLEVRLLKWSYSIPSFVARGTMMFDLFRWWRAKRIDFKFDTAHPIGASHHQKIAVVDSSLAVCGGIDMTSRRWDTREHVPHDRRRRKPGGGYYGPWHDASMMVEGEIAGALEELGRERWRRAGGVPLPPIEPCDDSIWPDDLEPQFRDVEVGVARTCAAYSGNCEIKEIETLFLSHIARARRFLYIESQYFASRAIADALATRLAEPDPPEVVLVNPLTAEGWLEQQAMDHARARLIRAVGECDHRGRFNVYVPWSGDESIYVHAKLMIVDDTILHVGSANLNNRSMGLDSECDLVIDCERPANGHCGDAISAIRHDLLAEHCGLDVADVPDMLARHGSMAGMIDHCRGRPRQLRRLKLPELNGIERALADSALLDPEAPGEVFEAIGRKGLFGGNRFLRPPRFRRHGKDKHEQPDRPR